MSDSQPATTRSPSRRGLLQSAAGCVLPIPSMIGAHDRALIVAQHWCALESEQRRLIIAWQDVETWLVENRDWPRLSEAEQAAVPEGVQLGAIEGQLDEIDKRYDALLPVLKATPATTRAGVLARFDALLWLLDGPDHPDACALLKSCQRDLERLWR